MERGRPAESDGQGAGDAGPAGDPQLIGEGININVTLLFSQKVYRQVAEAYLSGLEESSPRAATRTGRERRELLRQPHRQRGRQGARQEDRDGQRSGEKERACRRSRARSRSPTPSWPISSTSELFATSAGSGWRSKGAQTQRLLWASTGTKNKAYSDVLYVEELIGPDTVNTMPPATMDAFRDHGKPRASLEEDVDGAQAVMDALPSGRHLDRAGHRRSSSKTGCSCSPTPPTSSTPRCEKARSRARQQAQRDELQAAGSASRRPSRQRSRIGARRARCAGCGPPTPRCGPSADEANWLGWLTHRQAS